MRIRNICLFVLLNVMVVFMSCSDSEYDALRFCDSYGEKELTNAVVSVGEIGFGFVAGKVNTRCLQTIRG